ncbi:hypothetical protein J7M23_04595, partial [Candidatus Sumerlaeota bacterium]|nr:hypothetical protein [Candidatus Sumerlaeota bacterium]
AFLNIQYHQAREVNCLTAPGIPCTQSNDFSTKLWGPVFYAGLKPVKNTKRGWNILIPNARYLFSSIIT